MARRPLVTFDGWDGKWWRRIKVGKAVYEAALWVIPLKIGIPIMVGEEIIAEVRRRGTAQRNLQDR